MAMIERNGIRLAYDDSGAGEPIMVFVHGWTCDRSFFAPQAEAIANAIEAGNQEPRRAFISGNLFLPTSDPMIVERVLRVMMQAPGHAAANGLREILAFDGPAVAANCKVPALHLVTASPLNPPHLMSQWLPNVVHGQTVGAGHFNQLELRTR